MTHALRPLLLLGLGALAQEAANVSAPSSPTAAAATAADDGTPSQSAEALRSRIHGMRMNLLLGGDRVRDAEAEAVGFYNDKVELVESRLDTVQVELSEKNASYDVLLERALSDPSDTAGRREALQDATRLRSEIDGLESESGELEERRTQLSKLIVSVEARDRERERLATQLETASGTDEAFGMPFMRIGLAPAAEAASPGSPLADDELVRDLLERDPLGARSMLFDLDPVGYWERFPLQPPRAALQAALPFPPADLPGRR